MQFFQYLEYVYTTSFVLGMLRYNGDLVYLVSIHTKSGCQPNFDDDMGNTFPFNMQTCTLQFGSWINEKYKVEYRVPQQNSDGNNQNSRNFKKLIILKIPTYPSGQPKSAQSKSLNNTIFASVVDANQHCSRICCYINR